MARSRQRGVIALPWERQGSRVRELIVSGRWRWVLLGLGALGVAVAIAQSADARAKERQTREAIEEVHRALAQFRTDVGRCPHSRSELVMPSRAGARYLREAPVDAWGHPLWIRCPGRYDPNDVDVVSAGPSGNFLVDDNIL
jgi:type II secretory pathway pseudopilin PulG